MIAKNYRIPREIIGYILNSGDNLTSKLFIVRFKKSNEKFSRYRAIISKKIHKEAVKRNHLRRQIYEAIRQSAQRSSEPKGEPNVSKANNHLELKQESNNNFDIILIPKKRIVDAKFQEISDDIKHLTERLRSSRAKARPSMSEVNNLIPKVNGESQ